MLNERNRLMLLGLALLIFLIVSYFENVIFFNLLSTLFQNQLLAFFMIFIHNVTVVSLIVLGMTFYVNLVVSGYFKGQEYEYVILEHPRTFAVVFAVMIIFVSILRGSTLILGQTSVEILPKIMLASAPMGIIEGYAIYLTIKKVLRKTISTKDLVYIYALFIIASIIEVGFINLLK